LSVTVLAVVDNAAVAAPRSHIYSWDTMKSRHTQRTELICQHDSHRAEGVGVGRIQRDIVLTRRIVCCSGCCCPTVGSRFRLAELISACAMVRVVIGTPLELTKRPESYRDGGTCS